MCRFTDTYRQVFAVLGCELKPSDGCAESRLAAAEKRLGMLLPQALREYYLVAGREQRFNRIHDRLLAPNEWSVDGGHLVFMEENQAVVLWGVPASTQPATDPPVSQGANGDPVEWYPEHENCSVFLAVMIHWHGAYGAAMQYADTATVDAELVGRLDEDWNFVGEVNEMRAYNRPGQAVCFLKWDDPIQRTKGGSLWRIFVGAKTKEVLEEAASSLDAKLEGWCR